MNSGHSTRSAARAWSSRSGRSAVVTISIPGEDPAPVMPGAYGGCPGWPSGTAAPGIGQASGLGDEEQALGLQVGAGQRGLGDMAGERIDRAEVVRREAG